MLYFFIIILSFKLPPCSYPTIFYLEIAFSFFFFLDSWTMYLYLNTTGVFLYPLFYYFLVHTPVINHTIQFLFFLVLHYVDDLILQQNFMFLYCPNIQGVSRLVDITAGDDFLGLCDQKSSYKHVSDFERLRSYDRLKLRIEGNDYWQ
jgi:hypothetical protein